MKGLWSRVSLKEATERIRARVGSPASSSSSSKSSAAAEVVRLGSSSPSLSGKKAAVLVPLFENESGEVSVWLTTRSSTKVSTHKGEVSLPGGKAEDGETSVDTATREADEEVGISPARVEILGQMTPILSKHGLVVTPVVSTIPRDVVPRPRSEEVDVVFQAPLSTFLSSENHRSSLWQHMGSPYTVHFFEFSDPADKRTHVIWGFTALVLIEVARIVFARDPLFPGDLRTPEQKL